MEMNPYNNSSMEITLPIDYIGMTKEMQSLFESFIDDDGDNIIEYNNHCVIETYLRILIHSEGIKCFSFEIMTVDEDGNIISEQEFEPTLTPIEEDFYCRKAYEQVISNYHHY